MKKFILYIVFVFSVLPSASGTNRALTVFIGNYPESSGWNAISSLNDKENIMSMLHCCGFQPSDIVCLEDSEATYLSIIQSFSQLLFGARSGDRIYIHFSCHGQQITDQDGDEALVDPSDRFDEALIPYDAAVAYGWHGYGGEHHLLDDTINKYLSLISRAVGKQGIVLFVADACHSGDISREEVKGKELYFRGAVDIFDQPYRGNPGRPSVNPVTWISLSACKEFQTNFEVEVDGQRYGRLSYAISQCLRPGMTAGQLLTALQAAYRQLPMPQGKTQSPMFSMPETIKSRILFDGR